MEFRILGPLEVLSDTGNVPLGGVKKRAVLAVLLLHANEVVSVDRLVDELWPATPPKTAAKTVRVYVSQLRKAFDGDAVLERRGRGYALLLDGNDLDASRFEALLAEGRRLLAAGEPARATEVLGDALALWRGAPLADFVYEGFAQSTIARLHECRLVCLEERIEADLALGRHQDVIAELEALVRDHPLRERLRGQLMLALYRAARQSEALEVYRSTRKVLMDELGLEPGPDLQALERRILNQDPGLAAPPRETARIGARRRGRPWLLVGAGALVLAAALTAVLVEVVGSDEPTLASVAGNAVGVVDPGSNRLVAQIPVDRTPTAIAVGPGAVWVVNTDDETVSRIDPKTSTVVDSIPVGSSPSGVAVGGGTVWVTNTLDGTVSRIDPGTGTVVQKIPAGGAPLGITFGYGSIWVAASTDGTVRRIDATTGKPQRTIPVGPGVRGIAVGLGSVWVTGSSRGGLLRVDPATNHVTQVTSPIGNAPAAVAVGFGSAWVVNSLDGTVSRVDPRTNAVVATIPIGQGANGLTIGKDKVWVSDGDSGTLSLIDPSDNVVSGRVRVGNGPAGLALGPGGVYVAVGAPRAAHRGGTLTIIPGDPLDSIDPARAYADWTYPTLALTNDGLVAFRRTGGSEGARLVPDLATALPDPTDHGRTYTFRLRDGIRYSTRKLVRPSDVRRGIERSLQVPNGPGHLLGTTIVGAGHCVKRPADCDLSRGIETHDDAGTVTFHLTQADPELLFKLALPFAFPVPAGTPRGDIGMRPVPATGPYMIASASRRRVELVRNPRFHEWSRAAKPDGYPDRIVALFGVRADKRVSLVKHGRVDLAVPVIPSTSLEDLQVRLPGQMRLSVFPETDFVFLNTRLAPFDRPSVRRALNLAVDRNELTRLSGGPAAAEPTCQILPPGFPGYSSYCPYAEPTPDGSIGAPKLEQARRLVARSGTRGMRVVVWAWADRWGLELPYIVSVLRELGYDAHGRLRQNFDYSGRTDIKAGFGMWLADYPSPGGGFFSTWLTCDSYVPEASRRPFPYNNLNAAGFCDPAIDRRIRQASELQARDPEAATALWSEIDRRIVDEAPLVPLVNRRLADLVSKRVRNFQFHPLWLPLFDQIWVR